MQARSPPWRTIADMGLEENLDWDCWCRSPSHPKIHSNVRQTWLEERLNLPRKFRLRFALDL